ncbi:AAA family ATPase [Halobaculum sp. MBLA0147]|uniref:AAA family ATPase n=1 Tax=Halobaculum sp. MBLA0147 TaxID=3079934 RepID=UPI003526677B
MTDDGSRIFLAPYANEAAYSNFEKTVIEGEAATDLAELTDKTFHSDTVRLWGTTVSSWDDITPGDFLLFYREGEYRHAARVNDKEINEEIGRRVWPNHDEDDPWTKLLYLDDPVEINADSRAVHDMAGYENSYVIGFQPLNDQGVETIRDRFGSVEQFVYWSPDGSPEVFDRETDSAETDDREQRQLDDALERTRSIDVTETPSLSVSDAVLDGLYFPEEMAERIVGEINDALRAGKHVIFVGPPGTGKTEIARAVASELAAAHPEYYTGSQTTTATADWSTFETVGGYMPEEGTGEELSFSPGQVLSCFRADGRQRNDILVIDEINRADIDKSFGQLFTLLSGQDVQLPFTVEGTQVAVRPGDDWDGPLEPHEFVMPASWRLFGTMNSYDKTSLYEMSYAFMRRFAFVQVGIPEAETTDEWRQLVAAYAETWSMKPSESVVADVADVWRVANETTERQIGPALIRDVLAHVGEDGGREALTSAVAAYVFPQFEGLRDRDEVVRELAALDGVDRDRLLARAREFLQVSPDG